MSKDKDELADMLAQADAQKLAHDPILRKVFSVGILASDLFVPVEQSEDQQAQAGGVSLQAMPINDTPHVLLFSSKEKLGAFMGANTRFARASGLDILTQLQGSFAVLNPGPTGRALAPEDIAEILGKSANPVHRETGHRETRHRKTGHRKTGHENAGHVHGPNCGHKH